MRSPKIAVKVQHAARNGTEELSVKKKEVGYLNEWTIGIAKVVLR